MAKEEKPKQEQKSAQAQKNRRSRSRKSRRRRRKRPRRKKKPRRSPTRRSCRRRQRAWAIYLPQRKVVPELMQKFAYKTVMQVPRLRKITLNMGVGETTTTRRCSTTRSPT